MKGWLRLWLSSGWASRPCCIWSSRIDLIMKDFAPVAQRYLSACCPRLMMRMTFADWSWTQIVLWIRGAIDDLVMKSVTQYYQRGDCSPSRKNAGWLAPIVARILSGFSRVLVFTLVLMSWTGRLVMFTLIKWNQAFWSVIFSDNHQSIFNIHVDLLCREAPSTQWIASQRLLGT